MQILEWALAKLEVVRDLPHVLVRDPLRLLESSESAIDLFARQNSFALITAATNLAFRDTYEKVAADSKIKKVMVIDRASMLRRTTPAVHRAPPPFYPDLLAKTPPEARIQLDLRQYLQERTGDTGWPQETNDPRYANLIRRNLEGTIRAHQNLRAADKERFADTDFRTIVGFAALGVPEEAFKRLDASGYWKLALVRHGLMRELDDLAPQVTQPIKERLRTAPAPFCWLAKHDPELVLRAFYLSVLTAQHSENWRLLLANIDPALQPLSGIPDEMLGRAAHELIQLDYGQADLDLRDVEASLTRENLGFLLNEQYKIAERAGFAGLLKRERYSTLFRSAALLVALDQLLSDKLDVTAQKEIEGLLSEEEAGKHAAFVTRRDSAVWTDLKEAFRLAGVIQALRLELKKALDFLKVTPKTTFRLFRKLWNERELNRLEYSISALERLVDGSELLPRPAAELPAFCDNALSRIRHQVRQISEETPRLLIELNLKFQDLVIREYPAWVKGQPDVILTSQFLVRCLKPYWDPQKGKAAVFIFDGMRYDIWHEYLRPLLLQRMDEIKDLPGCALLPSETQITRKAISAGTYPDEFRTDAAEDRLLKTALARDFGLNLDVKVMTPEGSGTGETVRYRAGNLDVYIFELCDKELHKITLKMLPDGREAPSRPLAFIYQQHIQNLIDTEVMAIMRKLAAGTTVFVTADHGFGRVGRERMYFDELDLNEASDCSYLNCWLNREWAQANINPKFRANMIAFRPEQLRMPAKETWKKHSGETVTKEYKAVIFPRAGHSFSRPETKYKPDAYSHGGISLQELFIPMVVLRVKEEQPGAVAIEKVVGAEVVEGGEVELQITLRSARDDTRVSLEASYAQDPEPVILPGQVYYLRGGTQVVSYRFKPETGGATAAELKVQRIERRVTVTAHHSDGRKTTRKSATTTFVVRLNAEQVVRRVPPALGKILGLTPKGGR